MKLLNWEFLQGANVPFKKLRFYIFDFICNRRVTRPARKIRQEKITPLQSKFVVWMNHEANSVLLIWYSNLVSRVFSIFKMVVPLSRDLEREEVRRS